MAQMVRDESPAATAESAPSRPALRVCLHGLRPIAGDVRALRAAIALNRAGFEVTAVDIGHERSRPREEALSRIPAKFIAGPSEAEQDRIRVKHVRMPTRLARFYDAGNFSPWLLFKALRVVGGAAALLRTSADVYHACDITALPACYLAARLRRTPLVFEPYELPLVQPWIAHHPLFQAATARLLRTLLPRCSGIIVTSPKYAGEFHKRYGGRVPIVVRNIPLYQPPVASSRLREFLGLAPAARIALYQGGLNADRGLGVLIRAARHLAPGTFIVLKAWGEGQAEIESLIKREGAGDRVKLIPAVPYEDLQAWTGSADIGLVIYQPRSLSVRLTLPNKLFEYLMAGVPLLASSLDAVEALIRAYDVGCIVRTLEPEAVARAINAMLADPSGLARMRANALCASRRDLCWEVESQRLLQLYQHILGEDKSRAAARLVSG